MHISFLRNIIISALLLYVIQAKAEFHEFQLNDGRTVKAEMIKYNRSQKKVDLKREDGKIIGVKINIFIKKDQEYIVKWKKPPEGMVRIQAGTNSGTDPDFGKYSLSVTSFYMDQYEVTRELWKRVHKWAIAHGYAFDNSGDGKGSKYPVHTISWYDCVKWCNARSEMENRTPCYTADGTIYKMGQCSPDCNFDVNGFRLPTLVEWNYSARGGLKGKRFPWGDTISHDKANYNARNRYDYDDSSGSHPAYDGDGSDDDMPYTSPAGSFPPNNYGLCDMVGNVNEWCWDQMDSNRSTRGCSWGSMSEYARCGRKAGPAKPTQTYHGLGFRTVCR